MSWNERLQLAAYTSPSGIRLLFTYENVSKTVNKKTTGFEFPDANGTYVQDLGHTGRKYPLRIIFHGDDHDLESKAFESALLETGIGTLEHPLYGDKQVIPFGTITFRDNLKTAANQTIIDLVFWETIALVYPQSQTDPASSVITAVDEYNNVASESIDGQEALDTEVERVSFKNDYNALLGSAKSGLQSVADTQDNVKKEFDAINLDSKHITVITLNCNMKRPRVAIASNLKLVRVSIISD